jgi:hypothetical protein
MMPKRTKCRTRGWANRALLSRRICRENGNARLQALLVAALLAAMTMFSACGGSGSSSAVDATASVSLSGNWQFTMAPAADNSSVGGLQGGFLLQDNGAVTGGAVYAVSLPQLPYPCNSGSAQITGTGSGQSVSLKAVAGTQTFTLTGTVSLDGSTMVGTYSSTAGTASDGAPCGAVESGLQWSAILVPPMAGSIQGNFHSTGGASGLINQDFSVTGSLTQAANTGASSATVTGTLNFATSDYPCFNTGGDTAPVYGQISGNSVTLQIVGTDGSGSIFGQLGVPALPGGTTGLSSLTFDSAQGGYILHSVGPSYLVATNACMGGVASTSVAGDYGDLCLALGTGTACQQPITLSPAEIVFPAQTVGTTSTQTITLANAAGAALNGLTLTFNNVPGSATDFAETDTCGVAGIPAQGQPFNLSSGQSCVITISFTPDCATDCGTALAATLSVTSPVSADNDRVFTVPITGSGSSEDAVSNRATDFAAEVTRK